MVKIKCPDCHCGFDVDNVIGGRRLACECGAKWSIPELPPAGDVRLCVLCGRVSPEEAKVCPECSFNFLSGYRFENTSRERRESSFSLAAAARLVKAALLVLLIGAVLGIYLYATRSKIGASEDCPLGVMSRDGVYNEVAFKPYTDINSPRLAEAGLTEFGYIGEEETVPSIVIAADDKRIVHVIRGNYSTGTNMLGFKENSPVSADFFERLNVELKLPKELEIKETRLGEGRFQYTEFSTQFERGKLRVADRYTDRSFASSRTVAHRVLYCLDSVDRAKISGWAPSAPAKENAAAEDEDEE